MDLEIMVEIHNLVDGLALVVAVVLVPLEEMVLDLLHHGVIRVALVVLEELIQSQMVQLQFTMLVVVVAMVLVPVVVLAKVEEVLEL